MTALAIIIKPNVLNTKNINKQQITHTVVFLPVLSPSILIPWSDILKHRK